MKTYVMSDIHNDCKRFKNMLKKIQFSKDDKLYILGDIFDRADHDPNPVDLYFQLLMLGDSCVVIRGNHDQWLATYIKDYYALSERKRQKMESYQYNSFELLQERLTPVDIQELANTIIEWPLQLQIEVGGEKYLLAHAMTSAPEEVRADEYYLTGILDKTYFEKGIPGFTSICGHSNTNGRIFVNKTGSVYSIDCGCGYKNGKLSCLCLETKEEFYV